MPDERPIAHSKSTGSERVWRIHVWALTGNHHHLLLETPEANLVNGMKWLQGTYTQRYNARHRQRGHMFQGRYRAVPVAADVRTIFKS